MDTYPRRRRFVKRTVSAAFDAANPAPETPKTQAEQLAARLAQLRAEARR